MKKLAITMFFLLICGCGPELLAPIGPIINGVIYWKEGEATKYYAHNSTTLYRATKHSCEELDYTIHTDESKETGHFYIVAGENDRFKIKIEEVEKEISVVKCRVNFWGDKPYAELLYAKIDYQLNAIEFDENGEPVKNNFRR